MKLKVALEYISRAWKAVLAGAVTFTGSLGVVLVGDMGFDDVTAGQWVWIAGATLVALGGVYRVRNASPPAK